MGDSATVACRYDNYELARVLLKTTAASDLGACMYWACMNGNAKLVRLLIQHGANTFNYGFLGAIRGGRFNTAKIMIDHGAYELVHNIGYALNNGQYHLAEYMISKGGICRNDKRDAQVHNLYLRLWKEYDAYLAWKRCVLALPFLCEDVLRMVT